MFKNFMYVEYGSELPCHEKLYLNALKKQQKQKESDHQKQLQQLIQQITEIEDDQTNKPQISKDFYDYSMKWKNYVDQKKFQEQYRNEMSVTQKSQQQIQKLPQNYISPIDGWKEHAQQYFEKRENKSQNESFFQPTINEKSRMLEYDEPVEDRLLKYGQQREQKYLFEKQFEKFYDQVQISQRPRKPNEEVFERLYNHERKIPEPEVYQLQLNKLSPEFEERVNKRREQYNLFDNKIINLSSDITDQEVKKISQDQFGEFLKRNFGRHYKTQSAHEEPIESYSFQPELNKKSLEIASKNNENLIQRQEKFLLKKQQNLQQYLEEQQLENQRSQEKNRNKPNAKIHINRQDKSPFRQQNAYNLQQIVKQNIPTLF